MTRAPVLTFVCALAALAMLHGPASAAGVAGLVPAGATGTAGAGMYRAIGSMTRLSPAQKIALLRRKIKYVFVLFQENRSFDDYFSTYPGADGLFAAGRLVTAPGTSQLIRNTDGSYTHISPFLIPRTIRDVSGRTVPLYPEDTASTDHSHAGIVRSLHFQQSDGSVALNDGFALNEERLHFKADAATPADVVANATGLPPTANPSLARKQMAELVMAHVDCDTVPFLWQYADRFTLFDNFHMTAIAPSTPNAIAMIAGQVGDTQWALHPDAADPRHLTLPVLTDLGPYGGSSNRDHTHAGLPYGPDENPAKGQQNLTFATLLLSLAGSQIGTLTAADPDPAADLPDVQHDIAAIAAHDRFVHWGWYQQGFDREPFDGTTTRDGITHALHSSYVVHHNAPQYFGYLADNPRMNAMLHGLQDFYAAVADRALPAAGGVFYVRGGFYNNDGLITADPNPAVRRRFAGNDDHPSYSDSQISEAGIADSVNAIAASPYWDQSVIIITYDESDGQYDHVPAAPRTRGPDGLPETAGSRIPAIVISAYAAAHTIVGGYSEHSSVIRFIDALFGLVPLAELPDELRGRQRGAAQSATFHQTQLGPADALVDPMGDLTDAFDSDRLTGAAPPLPAAYATIPAARISALPHDGGAGCRALNIVPTDYVNGVPVDPPPADFNPRPRLTPGIPSSGTWTP